MLNTGDPLFGSTVTGLTMGGGGLDGDAIAFSYSLADGRSGIAVATIVPEPASWLFVCLGAAISWAVRRARR